MPVGVIERAHDHPLFCFIHCSCRDQAARFTLFYIALFKTVFLNVLDGFLCVFVLFFCTFPFVDDSLRLNV